MDFELYYPDFEKDHYFFPVTCNRRHLRVRSDEVKQIIAAIVNEHKKFILKKISSKNTDKEIFHDLENYIEQPETLEKYIVLTGLNIYADRITCCSNA